MNEQRDERSNPHASSTESVSSPEIENADAAQEEAVPGPETEAEEQAPGEGAEKRPGSALVEPPEEAVKRLAGELGEAKDRHLRLAADFDNFRKRVARERNEIWSRAQADVVSTILDALDDLGRVAALDPEASNAGDVIAGIELVERKFVRELENAGLKRVGTVGEAFDPNDHEAVATLPAESEEQENLVAAVLQPGYRFGGTLVRPARVQVFVTVEPAGNDDA